VTERLLTARELGNYLGLTAGTVLDWFEAGRISGFRLGGRKGGPVRFRLDEVEAMLEGWRVNGPGAGGEVAPVPYQSPGPRRSLTGAPVPSRGGKPDA
jgi:excisionase family DNA binding protein